MTTIPTGYLQFVVGLGETGLEVGVRKICDLNTQD